MNESTKPEFDFIAIGETLIDFISSEEVESFAKADTYNRFVGGQPTNLTRNMALLGNQVALGACVGDDYFGKYIIEQLDQLNIDVGLIQITTKVPTTLVPITRTRGGTPKFMIFRGADAHIQPIPPPHECGQQCTHYSYFGIRSQP